MNGINPADIICGLVLIAAITVIFMAGFSLWRLDYESKEEKRNKKLRLRLEEIELQKQICEAEGRSKELK